MTEININYLNEERIEAFKRIENIEFSLKELSENFQSVKAIVEGKIPDDVKIARESIIEANSEVQKSKDRIESVEANISEILSKIKVLEGKTNEYKAKIEGVYFLIFGYDNPDTGEFEEGLKEKLEKSYEKLSEQI